MLTIEDGSACVCSYSREFFVGSGNKVAQKGEFGCCFPCLKGKFMFY